MSKIHRIGLSLLIFVFCTGFDRLTKDFAQRKLVGAPMISLLDDLVRIQYTENTGAILSLGAQLPGPIRFIIFVLLVGLVLGAAVYAIRAYEFSLAQLTGLLLVISGGVGNFIDRLLNHGAAIDFMNIGLGSLRTGIFNFADVFIMAGAATFVLSSIRKETTGVKTEV